MSDGGPVPLLLDTHYWIWLQLGGPGRFTDSMRRGIRQAADSGSLLISVISIWEVGMLEMKSRLQLKPSCNEWVKEALATPGLSVAPLTPEIALDSCQLPEPFHGDPADRIIVATARQMKARLLTRDKKLLAYGRKRHVILF